MDPSTMNLRIGGTKISLEANLDKDYDETVN